MTKHWEKTIRCTGLTSNFNGHYINRQNMLINNEYIDFEKFESNGFPVYFLYKRKQMGDLNLSMIDSGYWYFSKECFPQNILKESWELTDD